MPPVQDTFANDYALGYKGMVANGETSNRISYTLEDAAALPFGAAAFQGADPKGCTATVTAGGDLGITIADRGQVALPGGTPDAYEQYRTVAIMQAGVIKVESGGALATGDVIAVLTADNTAFVVSGTAASTDLTGWVAIDDAAGAGEIVRIAKRIK